MGALYDALVNLSSVRDAEILDGYRRYESLLETILTPEQIETYADYINQVDVIRIFEEMSPDELANLPVGMPEIAAAILADTNISMENRRVVALLDQRGEDEITPDFNQHHENRPHESTVRGDAVTL
ncbi:MAG: hypothetical protein IT328_14910 [Caldilineaceae bacterium]|nr:hypothetical protein [Caldilineaceae bacterium]